MARRNLLAALGSVATFGILGGCSRSPNEEDNGSSRPTNSDAHSATRSPVSVDAIHSALTGGGCFIGKATRTGELMLSGQPVGRTTDEGLFFLGFDRDAPSTQTYSISSAGSEPNVTRELNLIPREYERGTISGATRGSTTALEDFFDYEDVDALLNTLPITRRNGGYTPDQLRQIREDAALKSATFDTFSANTGWSESWISPFSGVKTSDWGKERKNTDTGRTRVHYGVDLAGFTGDEVVAPASGTVLLAKEMFFEGNAVFIDHGNNLISVYLHFSRIRVAEGDSVEAGQVIGEIGSTGFSTGPHLCWRTKWRGRNLDPQLIIRP